jgi:hypothetical protein
MIGNLGNIPEAEHWTTWIARKTHKTHFRNRFGAHSDVHASGTNTPGLYDGSAEARYILQNTLDTWDVNTADLHTALNINGVGIVASALDYLKGKDLLPNRFSHAKDFFTDLGTWVEQLTVEPPPETLVQIEQVEEYPEWNPNHEPKTGC